MPSRKDPHRSIPLTTGIWMCLVAGGVAAVYAYLQAASPGMDSNSVSPSLTLASVHPAVIASFQLLASLTALVRYSTGESPNGRAF